MKLNVGILVSGALFLAACSDLSLINRDSSSVQPTTAFTILDLKKNCKKISEHELGASFACDGYRNYKVLYASGDDRVSVKYGYVDEKFSKSWESFASFNSPSKIIEWYIVNDKPVAAIQSWYVGDGINDRRVIVVSKVGQPNERKTCVMGYIYTSGKPEYTKVKLTDTKHPRFIARQVAGKLWQSFRCAVDEPKSYNLGTASILEVVRSFDG